MNNKKIMPEGSHAPSDMVRGLYGTMADEYFCRGEKAFESKDYVSAVKDYSYAAGLGHTEGAYMAGRCYYRKLRKGCDYYKAVEYFEMASCKGHAEATYYLAECYRCGRGVRQNAEHALELYRSSAELGCIRAQKLVAKIDRMMAEDKG